MMDKIYSKPPVTEAVIALHFQTYLEDKWLKSFSVKKKKEFPKQENIVQMRAMFDAAHNTTASDQTTIGMKLFSKDGASIISILRNQVMIPRQSRGL